MEFIIDLILIIVRILGFVVPILLAVAFMTLVERKLISGIQRRIGPNVVGIYGLLQPFADAVKLLAKETVVPSVSNIYVFFLAPILTLFLSLLGWAVIPIGNGKVVADVSVGLLFVFAVSSLGVYGVILSGWASNSRYAFLGSLRSAAQMVSYEVSIGLIVISVLLFTGSLNLTQVVEQQDMVWYIIPLHWLGFMFFISALAETNRPPFDLPEAEAELVAGYFVEYTASSFALFFIGEYANIILMSALCVIFFLGGWQLGGYISYGIKLSIVLAGFIWVRAAFPRYRYDQLMSLGWKVFLPGSFAFVVMEAGVLFGILDLV